MNRWEKERRKKLGLPLVSGSTRRSGESLRAWKRRKKRMLPPYRPDGGHSGSNVKGGQIYADNIWSGTGAYEG